MSRAFLALQGFLFGAASMNAFWHPSAVTVGLLPAFAVFTFAALRCARGRA
jgi:hypothetical protein